MKYYVTDGVERSIVDAKNEMDACIKCVKHRFSSIPVGRDARYVVSEAGFRGFLGVNDTLISADLVLQKIMDESDEEA